MKIVISFVLIISVVFSQNVGAVQIHSRTESTKKVAINVARFLKSVGTFSQLIRVIEDSGSIDAARDLKKQLLILKISLDEKIPEVVAEGSKLRVSGERDALEIRDDFSVRFKGRVFEHDSTKLNEHMTELSRLAAAMPVSTFLLLIPPAEAQTSRQIVRELGDKVSSHLGDKFFHQVGDKSLRIGALYATFLGIVAALDWAGATYSLGTGFAMVGLPWIAVGLQIWIGFEIYQTIRDGEVSCVGKEFVARRKSRAVAIFPTSETSIIDLKIAQLVLQDRRIEDCTPEAARKLQIAIRDKKTKKVVFESQDSTQTAK